MGNLPAEEKEQIHGVFFIPQEIVYFVFAVYMAISQQC